MPQFQFNMGGKITPAVTVVKASTPKFPLKALYIEAFDEYFTEVTFIEERETLLEGLEYLLKKNPHLICFLSMPACSVEECLKLIPQYLGEGSAVEQQLRMQIKEKFGRPQFLLACAQAEVETVHIGGVYGRACVSDCARSIGADNIYTKQLPDKHPNIRYRNPKETYRFKNAVIIDDVTEGYIDSEITLNQLACFPAVKEFVIDPGQVKDIVTLGEEEYAGEVGESYESFSSVDDETLGNYYELHTQIQKSLTAVDLLRLKHSFSALKVTSLPASDTAAATTPSATTSPCA